MPDVLAWEAGAAEHCLREAGFQVVRSETRPLKPYEEEPYWRVVRQRLLSPGRIELTVTIDLGYDQAKTYLD